MRVVPTSSDLKSRGVFLLRGLIILAVLGIIAFFGLFAFVIIPAHVNDIIRTIVVKAQSDEAADRYYSIIVFLESVFNPRRSGFQPDKACDGQDARPNRSEFQPDKACDGQDARPTRVFARLYLKRLSSDTIRRIS